MMDQEPQQSLGQRLTARLVDILWHKPYDILELTVAVILFAFSVQLANPFVSTFTLSPQPFRSLAELAPEIFWGGLGMGVSGGQIVSTIWQWYWGRVIFSAAVACYLLFFGINLLLASPYGTGWVTYTSMGLFGLLIFIRTMKDV